VTKIFVLNSYYHTAIPLQTWTGP